MFLKIERIRVFLGKVYKVENVSVFELQSMQKIDCNLAIWLIESKYLKRLRQ